MGGYQLSIAAVGIKVFENWQLTTGSYTKRINKVSILAG
jgi:hypothetical protein